MFLVDLLLDGVLFLYGGGWRLRIIAPILFALTMVTGWVLFFGSGGVFALISFLMMVGLDIALVIDLIRNPPEMEPYAGPGRL